MLRSPGLAQPGEQHPRGLSAHGGDRAGEGVMARPWTRFWGVAANPAAPPRTRGGGSPHPPSPGRLTWLAAVARWFPLAPPLPALRCTRLRPPQLRQTRPPPPLTGSPAPRSLIWRRSLLRGLPAPSLRRARPDRRARPRASATPPRPGCAG
jgi:hypothetical protein